jgi:hypothetical protein
LQRVLTLVRVLQHPVRESLSERKHVRNLLHERLLVAGLRLDARHLNSAMQQAGSSFRFFGCRLRSPAALQRTHSAPASIDSRVGWVRNESSRARFDR